MPAHEPEDWPRVFEQHLNAGDLEAVVALYADVHGRAIEIVRRQPDGTWKLIVGDPHGRG